MATARRTHGSTASIGAGLLFGAGAAALGVFAATRPLVGVAAYVVAAAAALVLWRRTDSTAAAGDDSEPSPAEATLGVLGVASAVVFPALVAADGLGYFAWTELTAGIALAAAGTFVVFGAFSLRELLGGGGR